MTRTRLAQLMVGREVLESPRADVRGRPGVRSCSRSREVEAQGDKGGVPALPRREPSRSAPARSWGIAAVAGNGQSDSRRSSAGSGRAGGRVIVGGEDIANRPVRKGDPGGGWPTSPRTAPASAPRPNLSLVDNLIMKRYRTSRSAGAGTIDMGAARAAASELKESYEISAPSIETQARLLSGGNIQRPDPCPRDRVRAAPEWIAVQPTRGLDVGAVESAHRLLMERRTAGAAILLISEDLDEVLTLSDRVAVMFEGRIVGITDAAGADIGRIGLLMTGGAGGDAA